MPKMKTNKGCAKRIRKTGSGKFKRSKACKQHKLEVKSSKTKRNLRKTGYVSESETKRLKQLLPYE